jgi:excinuclease UvrABC nuclease subunit
MAGRMTERRRVTESNVATIPKQSGVYMLHRASRSRYVGSAGARRLQLRIRQQLRAKRGITSFQYRPTSSQAQARSLEKQYRDRLNPGQSRV